MSTGDPIDFDFSGQPVRHDAPASGVADASAAEDAVSQQVPLAADAPGAAGSHVPAPGADLPPIPPPPPASAADPGRPHPFGAPITDFGTRAYPFATTSRFQQGGFSDPAAPARASHGQRLTWGILAALGAVLFAASVIVLMQALDRSMHG